MDLWSLVVSFVCLACMVLGQWRDRHRPCLRPNYSFGTCVPFSSCPSISKRHWENDDFSYCGYFGRHPKVCCPKPEAKPRPRNKCGLKCEEYHKINEILDDDDESRFHSAEHDASLAREFPHMAALGFGEESDIQWRCGASLISERFVLTAGHCLYSLQLGDVKFVRLGDLNILSDGDNQNAQQFKVLRRIGHPEYSPPSQYNDVALLELDGDAKFTDFVKPICLQANTDLDDTVPIATGWGSVENDGEINADLKRVELYYFSIERCRQTYGPTRQLEFGVLDDLQICAGGINDTCQGDSGGPLQVRVSSHPVVHNIVGITSFGKACGVGDIPGVYTRVSSYVEWIEQVVWPN